MPYQVAIGHDNAAGLSTITPQPATPDGLRYPEINYGGDGTASFNGHLTADLVWNNLVDRDRRAVIAAQFGLSDTVASALVTVRILKNDDTFANFNCTANATLGARRTPVAWQDFRIILTKLEAL